jgi:protein SCO1/2
MKNWRIWLALALVIVAGATIYIFLSSSTNTQSYEGTELSGEAPDFQLTDQNGSSVGLSDFRGKVVVLTFMDTKCQDTCPLTAAQFREVYRQLTQNEATQVVFLGVNVNVEKSDVSDVLETTHAWRLDEIPSWRFLTGEHHALEPVWKDYGVAAVHNSDGNSIMHTPGTFLIDPLGQKRWYISTPFFGESDANLTLPLSELLLKHIRAILRESSH